MVKTLVSTHEQIDFNFICSVGWLYWLLEMLTIENAIENADYID